jgi:hypothetical protein
MSAIRHADPGDASAWSPLVSALQLMLLGEFRAVQNGSSMTAAISEAASLSPRRPSSALPRADSAYCRQASTSRTLNPYMHGSCAQARQSVSRHRSAAAQQQGLCRRGKTSSVAWPCRSTGGSEFQPVSQRKVSIIPSIRPATTCRSARRSRRTPVMATCTSREMPYKVGRPAVRRPVKGPSAASPQAQVRSCSVP